MFKIVFITGWGIEASIGKKIEQMLNQKIILINLSKDLYKEIPANSIIIAWSLGGLFAINYCYLFPNNCAKLILLSSTPKFIKDHNWLGIEPLIAKKFSQDCNQDYENLIDEFIKLIQFPNKDLVIRKFLNEHKSNNKKDMKYFLKLLFEEDYREKYKKLTIPILHILGSLDPIIPIEIIDHLNLLNSNNVFKIIDQAGHIPFLTHTNLVKKYIEDFII